MSAIFISHSSKDNAIAGAIKGKLAEQGHRSVFLDFDPAAGIPAGRQWEKEIYVRLRGCQAVIVLCSEHSMASPWCFAEITQARALGKHLFPLKVAACQISPLLSDVQVIDLTLNPTEGYQRLWSGLRNVGLDPTDLFNWDGTRSPYPGLLAFQEHDAAVYFGRDSAIQGTIETLNRLQRLGNARLALVLGASGSGKSSLVRAGVIPRLKRDKERWLVLVPFRPLARPFDELAMVLASAFGALGDPRDWKSIRDTLIPKADNDGSAHLIDFANDLRVMTGRREATVLLAVDQFEELLGRETDQSASHFLRILTEALSQPNSPFLALATLRSDFLGALQTHDTARELPYEAVHLPQLALADFAQVIEAPAKIAGVDLEAGLTQTMVAETVTDDALPLLAFTLRELWDRQGSDGCLTLAEYRDRLGGLKGSVARAAEGVCQALSLEQERHLRKAFLMMVRIDEEGRYIRKPARWAELPENVHDLLERFVQARLLVSRGEGMERILEVTHDALFRSWDRLTAWLNLDREFLLWGQRLHGAIADWERTGRDAGTLLRGSLLAEASRWLDERGDELDSTESGFIQASRDHEVQELQRWKDLYAKALSRQLAAHAVAESDPRAGICKLRLHNRFMGHGGRGLRSERVVASRASGDKS
jgi:TIR domain